jgi:2-oxoglutarate ferredoxin oxidoreductase subunit alpha
LASIGMVLGAGWAGARSMTSTAGPGLSLMAEFAGLAYYGEIPSVIVDVQRLGPSTGLPTRTSQGDILSAAFLSHGDRKHIVLLAGSVEECYEFVVDAFNLSEQFQTLIMVMTDLDLGMNNWMSDAFKYPTAPIARGKVLNAEQLEALKTQGKTFERYRDVDGDGIPYRTLPGTNHPDAAFFTRGSGHNEKAQYSEKPEVFARNMDRLAKKFETAKKFIPAPIVKGDATAEVGFIAYGSTDAAMQEAIDLLIKAGVKTEYLRLRAYPFTDALTKFIASKKRVYIVEQNRDAQLKGLMKMDYEAEQISKFRSVLNYDGMPIDARSICDSVLKQEGKL